MSSVPEDGGRRDGRPARRSPSVLPGLRLPPRLDPAVNGRHGDAAPCEREPIANLAPWPAARADPRHRGELFAERGFHGVSVVELGAACGISGPALYKHFAVQGRGARRDAGRRSASELLSVGRRAVARPAPTPADALRALVAWHVDFALHHQPLIVVQDRDWASLPDDAREQVRSLQREYVDLWADRLREVHAGPDPEARPGDGARGVRADQLHAAQRDAPRARRWRSRCSEGRWRCRAPCRLLTTDYPAVG